MLDDFRCDLRYAWRAMQRAPLFSAVAVASLALGIGANTAIFSLLDQVLWRCIAVREPGQLVLLESPGPQRGFVSGRYAFSYPMYRDLRDSGRVFEGLAARFGTPVTLSTAGGQGQRVDAELVSGNFFQVLGAGALLGRTLAADDAARPGEAAVAVVDAAFWRTHYGADPDIAGRTVRLNGQPFEIVGVAAETFHGVQPGYQPAFYLPLTMKRQITPTWDELENRRAMWLQLLGRLKPGVSLEQAQAGLEPLYRSILEAEIRQMPGEISGNFRRRFLSRPLLARRAAGGVRLLREQARIPLLLLMSGVGLVLLIACANVANLLLARAGARRKEVAVRLALGARRRDLIRQLMAESLLLAVLGGLAGLAVAGWTLDGLLDLLPQDGWRLAPTAQLDWRVLAFTAGLSLLTGVLFGLLPALQVAGTDPLAALRYE
jgi:predicted permease